jgi:prephenate dehydrogenase
MKPKKITIIGVGLIGGSIALAAKKRRLAGEIAGVFRRRATLRKALKFGAVDRGTMDMADGVRGAGLIILAAPVLSIPRLAAEAMRYAESGAVMTDVGSTKSWIVDEIERMSGRAGRSLFVGSHPMAGSEHTGVEFARPDLLDGSPCIVTRTGMTDPSALNRVKGFWAELGAKVTVMSPAEHDRIVSLISHLAHIVAFSLAGAVPVAQTRYAAEGFRDTTRVASSDPELWADIFLTNRKEIKSAAGAFSRFYDDVVRAILRDDRAALVRLLKKAKSKRDNFAYGGKK